MNRLMGLVIKAIIKKPERMESFIFKKLMEIFPARFAKRFDPITNKLEGYKYPFGRGLKRSLLDESFAGDILDIGTGTGFAAFELATVFPKSKIVGVDLAEQMLSVAKTKKEHNQINNISFILGSVDNLPFSDSTFDLVTVSNAPFNLKEITRVLKKEGLFLFSLSIAGEVIVNNVDGIKEFLSKYNLEIIAIERAQNGAFVLSMLK